MNDFLHVFSRKDALEEGVQILVLPKISAEAGFRFPVYITRSVWDKYVEVPKGMEGFQDLDGRLWDILTMMRHAAKNCSGSYCEFTVAVALPDQGDWSKNEKVGETRQLRVVKLSSVVGPTDFDDPSPCICIMLPDED